MLKNSPKRKQFLTQTGPRITLKPKASFTKRQAEMAFQQQGHTIAIQEIEALKSV